MKKGLIQIILVLSVILFLFGCTAPDASSQKSVPNVLDFECLDNKTNIICEDADSCEGYLVLSKGNYKFNISTEKIGDDLFSKNIVLCTDTRTRDYSGIEHTFCRFNSFELKCPVNKSTATCSGSDYYFVNSDTNYFYKITPHEEPIIVSYCKVKS